MIGEESLLDESDVAADKSDTDRVSDVLDKADESDNEPVWGEVGNVPEAEEVDGEPSADASSRNAVADGYDMLTVFEVWRELWVGMNEGLVVYSR